jgi:peroxiredoxin|tara:strand:- start:216 stop:533 length:318 start_codon:yes stop_codon:yes gene_type:complete
MEEQLETLRGLDVSIVAASVDDEEKAAEVAAELSFPVAHGVTRAQADSIDAWWEDRRGIIQPSEFLLNAGHKVLFSTYSSGPLGRMNPPDVVKLVQFMEKQKQGG